MCVFVSVYGCLFLCVSARVCESVFIVHVRAISSLFLTSLPTQMEYMVLTSAHRQVNGLERFMSSLELLQLCAEYKLPANDTWLFHDAAAAAQAHQLISQLTSGAVCAYEDLTTSR